VERARIVLLANAGRTDQRIAEALRPRTARVSKWRQRGAKRLGGLGEAARSGKPAKYDQATEKCAGFSAVTTSACISTDPEFRPKAADVVGLY